MEIRDGRDTATNESDNDNAREAAAGEDPHGDQRGFATMNEDKQREIASKGGKAAHQKGTAHEFTRDEARAAGRKGGEVVSQNKNHMANIGRKGGVAVSQNRDHMAAIGRKGGQAVSGDRAHMAAIGRKGGEARGGTRAKSEPPPPLENDNSTQDLQKKSA